ncbi:Ig-like domain-containing protein [Halovivax cerinus]|uniref:Ig-like domain-containing protein n=1 Tax=Halovivax cerinus TaxID=1487865 RepID=A0ABD5NJD4_9EURY|nr:Ig-like domain-containing protein [Halovivax cerinus]
MGGFENHRMRTGRERAFTVFVTALVVFSVIAGPVGASLGAGPAGPSSTAAAPPAADPAQPVHLAGDSRNGVTGTPGVDGSVAQTGWPELDAGDWGVAGRDPGRSGHNPNASGPKTNPDARWIYEFANDDWDVSAVASGALAFVAGYETLRAVDTDTGEVAWNVSVGDNYDELSAANGVVVTTEGGSGGEIHAYDTVDGAERWNRTSFDAGASVILDDTFYVSRGEYLHAFDLQTGTELWSYDLNEDISNGLSATGETIYATGLVSASDPAFSAVFALNATDGSERWRFEMDGLVSMHPVVVDGSVYVGAGSEPRDQTDGVYDPKFYRLNATDGHVEWLFDANTRPNGAAVADGSVYLSSGNTVRALDVVTGELQWRHRLPGSITYGLHYGRIDALPPAVADGVVYAANDRGHLVALDGATGTELSRYRFEGSATAPVIADDRIYVHTTDGTETNTDYTRVYALEETPFEFSGLSPSKTTVAPGEAFTVDVTVENVDDETRDYNLSLRADLPYPDGEPVLGWKNGTIASGATTSLAFTTALDSAASWNLSVHRLLETESAIDPVTVDVVHPTPDDRWAMAGSDAHRTDANSNTDGPSQYFQQAWNVSGVDEDTTPVIDDGTVYHVRHQNRYDGLADVHAVSARDETTGDQRWAYNFTADNRRPAGSPAVVNDTVYVATRPFHFFDGGGSIERGTVYAFDANTGAVDWTTATTINESHTSYEHGPVVANGLVYVAGTVWEPNKNYENASVVALDAETGGVAWSNGFADRWEHEGYGTYAADAGHLFVTARDQVEAYSSEYEEELYAYDAASGSLDWTTSALNLVVDHQETPVVADGLVFVVNESDSVTGEPGEELVAINVSTGAEEWRFTPSNIPNSYGGDDDGWRLTKPAVSDGSLFVRQRAYSDGTYSRIHRIDAETGDAVWNRSTNYLQHLQVADGVIYGGETEFSTGHIRLYDAETGEKHGDSEGRISVAVANGTVLTYEPEDDRMEAVVEGGVVEFTNLSVDTHTVGEHENVTVTATATNVGALPRTYALNLDLAPDDYSDHHFWNSRSREGTLAPGESETITWSVRLDERGDFVFFLQPGAETNALDHSEIDRAGSVTVHVGDDRDGTVVDLGGPRDLASGPGSWPTESFDAGNTGNYTGTGAPTAVGDDTVTWLANQSTAWDSGPTVVGDTIFVGGRDSGGDRAVLAVNATDGSLRWEHATISSNGVEVPPVYAGGYLYALAADDRLYQLNATTGERLWTFDAGDDSGLTVVDDVVFVAGESGTDDAVFALNATTREVLWTFTRSSSGYGLSKPAVENGTVYVTHDSQATYAIDVASGETVWSVPIAGASSRLHSPVVADGVVYVDDTTYSSTDANVYALDPSDGHTIWSAPANVDGYTGSSPALANDTLYFTADGSLRAVDATTGTDRWSTSTCVAARHSPVYADGYVFVPMADSTVRTYDADTGDLVWRYEGYDEYAFTPAIVDGLLYTTGLENAEYVHSLVALSGGTTAEPTSMIDFGGLDVSPTDPTTGEDVTITANAKNNGDAACGYTADLVIDGVVEDTDTGTISSGATTEVAFTHTFSATGTYDVSIADLPSTAVTVTGPEPDVDVAPGSWDYGTVDVGEWTYTDFEVSNVGTADLDWTDSVLVGPDADEFDITSDDSNKYDYLPPGGSGYVRVSTAPTTAGTKTATLQVQSDDPDEPRFNVSLTAEVVGPPEIDVSPMNHDFGDVEVGENATTTIAVSNVGGGPLSFDGAQLTGADAGAYTVTSGGGATSIAAGGSHDVTVEFEPAATGQLDATLTLSSDDADEPTVDVALAGNGTITTQNRAPIAVADHYTTGVGETLTVDAPGRLANDLDPEGDAITTTNTGSPDNGTVSSVVDGSFTYTPDPGFVGTDSFRYLIRDEHGTYSSYGTVTVEVVDGNRAPVAVQDSYSVYEGETLHVSAPGRLANDYDPDGDAITTTNTGSPDNGTVSGVVDGSFTYTPDSGFTGTDSFRYLIRDDQGTYSSYGTVTVEVLPDPNQAPIAVDDHYSIAKGENLTVSAPGRLANDYDPDGDAITTTNTGSPDNGTVSGVVDGSFTYRPDPDFAGTDSFRYLIRDEHGAYSSYGTVIVEVVDGNRAPVAVDDYYSIAKGENLTVSAPGRLANDYDPDGDDLTTTNTGSPDNGTVSGVVDGSFTYRPDPGFVGTDSFRYLIRDEHETYSSYGTVTVEVFDTNGTAPVAVDDHFTTIEGQALTVDAPGRLANDYDPEGDDITTTNTGSPDNGTVSGVVDGSFTYTPDPGFTGTDSFDYIIRDEHGTYSSYGTVTVEVFPDPNQAPIAVDDHYTTIEGQALTVDAPGRLANDHDPDGDDITTTNTGSPDNGTVSGVVDGSFTYTPDPGFVGTDSFRYLIRDDQGTYSTYGTVTVEVVDGNRAPVAVDDYYSMVQGETLTVDAPGRLANDRDPDGDVITTTNTGSPDNGTVSGVVDGSFTYTPDPDFAGTDSFVYLMRDEHGAYSSYGTVTVEVSPDPNRAPVAVPDHFAVLQGESLDVAAPGRLANDYDLDGDDLITTNTGSPAHGTTSGVVDGSVTYTPDPGFVGVDSFDYRIRDEHGTYSDYSTVTVTVVDADITVGAEISVTPGTLDFGTTPVGSTRTKTITVANVGDRNLTLSDVTLAGPEADAFAITAGNGTAELGYGETEGFTVAYTPTALGTANATVTVHSDDPDEPTVDVSLAGSGSDDDAPTVDAIDVASSARDGATVYANGTTDVDVSVTVTDALGSVQSVRVELDARASPARRTETALFDATSGTWTASFDPGAIAADGRYDVSVEAVDDSGNRVTVAAADEVVVDRIAPQLAAIVDRVDATTGNVTVDASEPLRDGTLSVVLERPDGTNETVAVTGSNDAWTGTFALPEDGQYNVTATALDLAGNRATDEATARFLTGETDGNDTILLKMVPSGLFVEFTTDQPVTDTSVTMTESTTPLKPLDSDQLGVNFLNAALENRLADNLSHAVVGVPVDRAVLGSGTDADDVTIRHFDDDTNTWSAVPTTVENVTLPDGTIGDYWVANVTHFSTYGAIATDATPPGVTETNPTAGNEFAAGTSAATLRMEFEDAGSGVDASETVIIFDDTLVTFDDAATITSEFVEYEATGLTDGSSHSFEVVLADVAGNVHAETIDFSIGEETGGGSPTLPPPPSADISVSDLSVEPSTVEPGEPVTVTVHLENTGAGSGDHTVDLAIGDDEIVSEPITVEAGATATFTTPYAFDEPGTYTVAAGPYESVVEVLPEASGGDDPDDEPGGDGDDSTAGSGTDGENTGPGGDESAADGSDSIPGFGLLAAILAIALAAWRRQNR